MGLTFSLCKKSNSGGKTYFSSDWFNFLIDSPAALKESPASVLTFSFLAASNLRLGIDTNLFRFCFSKEVDFILLRRWVSISSTTYGIATTASETTIFSFSCPSFVEDFILSNPQREAKDLTLL